METDAYHWIAKVYDKLFEPILGPTRRLGLEFLPPSQGMVILDAGCGTGAFLDLYRNSGARLLGIDQSRAMLTQSKRRLGADAVVVRADASIMPYADTSVDLILLSMTLHELDEVTRRGVILEARRVLKEDGRILVLDYHPGPYPFPSGWIAKALITLVERSVGREHFRHHRAFLAAGGVPALAADYDFLVEKRRISRGGSVGLFLLRRS